MQRVSLRTLAVMIHDILIVIAAFSLAAMLLDPSALPRLFSEPSQALSFFSVLVAVQFLTFWVFGVYRAMLRFSSIPDLTRIARGASLAVPLSFFFTSLLGHPDGVKVTTFILDWFLLLFGLNVGRLAYRMVKDGAIQKLKEMSHESYQRTFILGAGVAGERLLREISHDTSLALKVVGFVDDQPSKIGKSIRGVNIYGPINQLSQLISAYDVQNLIIAMPSASQEEIRHITQICRSLDKEIQLKILPRMADVLHGHVSTKILRNVQPEDLLGRKAHDLDIHRMSAMVKDKSILVTGAGGSIGSELCRQIAKFQPKSLILFEMTELFLYELEMALSNEFPDLKIVPIIGDVRHRQKLSHVFETYRPEVVFHAAAYKHVPLMEFNPVEAIRTNVLGTQNVASMAAKHRVDRFVLISSDKAINPTN
ncbi:MAG: polysaccharide biosynthesis protein, partial [Bdellovibrio sp. CG10_big_fil_rev_8_21_14_0_10_47_8]